MSIPSRASIVALLACAAACSSAAGPDGRTSSDVPLTISSAYAIAASSGTVRDPNARIRYVLHITNGSTTDEQVSYGDCWATVQLFASPARTGSPVFDSSTKGTACTTTENLAGIAPGESTDLVGYLDVAAAMAAGVTPGHYYVTLVVAPNGSTTPIAAGDIDIQQ
jgi:hypothetical protein